MKQQMNVRVALLTKSQFDWLMEKWGTNQVETLTIAIDRAYQQENPSKGLAISPINQLGDTTMANERLHTQLNALSNSDQTRYKKLMKSWAKHDFLWDGDNFILNFPLDGELTDEQEELLLAEMALPVYDVNVTFDNGKEEDYYSYGKYGVTTDEVTQLLQNADLHHFIEIKTKLPSEPLGILPEEIEFAES